MKIKTIITLLLYREIDTHNKDDIIVSADFLSAFYISVCFVTIMNFTTSHLGLMGHFVRKSRLNKLLIAATCELG